MDGADRSDERERKNYDSDSGLSEDNDTKAQSDAKPEKDADLADETDQEEAAAAERCKGLSDCVSGEYTPRPAQSVRVSGACLNAEITFCVHIQGELSVRVT